MIAMHPNLPNVVLVVMVVALFLVAETLGPGRRGGR